MSIDDVRVELEEDLTWRLDEIRHLRNTLLGEVQPVDWTATAMRAILVMQYAHLEGFARNVFSVYVGVVNRQNLSASEVHPHLFASALTAEFDAVRRGLGSEANSDDGMLLRRAKNQVEFVNRLRSLDRVSIDADTAVSMEMNFGADVFRRTLYRLGIPESEVGRTYYVSLEFVRTMRNDIAHGSRRERISPGAFESHQRKCEEFMNELVRLITSAIRQAWFKQNLAS